MANQLGAILQNDLGVAESYQHFPKRVAAGECIETNDGILKWYQIAPEREPVPGEIDRLARSYLTTSALEATGLGFLMLHRCGSDFYFLIVSTSRGNNEVWETVFSKNSDGMHNFALWPRDGAHKPTFCVWELAAVWHEKEAWERFLLSPRDKVAAQVWQGDLHAGSA